MKFATYTEALNYIHGLPRLKRSNSRAELQTVLATLGHPEQKGSFIHVTGTNGKGSTTNGIAHILLAAGLHVGMFTSPFINRFNERIQIDGQPVSDAQIATAASVVATAIADCQDAAPGLYLKEFEFVTAMGFWLFADAAVDVAVVEVGIGGAHDSTNVIMPVVAVITNVARDHMEILGDTLTAIATEKSGIIKSGVATVVGQLPDEALVAVRQRVAAVASSIAVFGVDFNATGSGVTASFGEHFTYTDADGRLTDLKFPLLGAYQAVNASVAIRAAKLFMAATHRRLDGKMIRRGIAAATWPVRLEKISDEPLIVLDGAHNPDGIRNALNAVKELHVGPVTIIAGILADKALGEMLTLMRVSRAQVLLAPVPGNPRAATDADYQAAGAGTWPVYGDWREALAVALEENTDGLILIMGSLYLAADVRQTLVPDLDGGEES